MKKKIAIISYNLNPASSLTKDAIAVKNFLNNNGYDCELVSQWSLNEANASYFKQEHDWERFDGIVLCNFFGFWDTRELIKSGRPVICLNASYADNFGIGTRLMEHKFEDDFNITNNTHPVISSLGLALGSIDIGNSIWTDSVNSSNQYVDVLIKSLGGQPVLVTHKTRRLSYFGWYRMSQAALGDTIYKILLSTANWTFS